MKSHTVISLGGSIVAPGEVNVDFLSVFLKLINKRIRIGESFIIVVGGGRPAREYQRAAKELGVTNQDELDWVGISATRLNAELLRAAFKEMAAKEVVINPNDYNPSDAPVTVAAGWKPGWSTDLVCVLMTEKVSAKRLANISNVDFVYDKDPKKFPEARKIERASWREFRSVIGDAYLPGMNVPFDPVAAREAEKLGLEVAIMNGKPLDNLENYLAGKPFAGSVIL